MEYTFDLKPFFAMILRYWRLIIFITLVGLTAGVGYQLLHNRTQQEETVGYVSNDELYEYRFSLIFSLDNTNKLPQLIHILNIYAQRELEDEGLTIIPILNAGVMEITIQNKYQQYCLIIANEIYTFFKNIDYSDFFKQPYSMIRIDIDNEPVLIDTDFLLPILPSPQHIPFSVVFVILGGVGGVVLALIVDMTTSRLHDGHGIRKKLKIPSFVNASINNRKRWFISVDRWVDRLCGNNRPWLSYEDAIDVTSAELSLQRNENADKYKLFITGTVNTQLYDKVYKDLETCLSKHNIHCIPGENLTGNAEAIRSLSACNGVMLIEEKSVSRITKIADMLDTIKLSDKKIEALFWIV
jgi:capsular polysaccharide biosynthesis protein